MTAERWLAGRVLFALWLTAAVVLLLVAGIDAIERSRLLGVDGDLLDLVALVGWRLPALGRELVPVWAAVSAALSVGWLVRSGAWEALAGAGLAEARAAAVVLVVVGVVGGGTAAVLELLTPVSVTHAAAAESRLSGRPARLAGGWVRLGELAFRVGAAEHGVLVDVTVIGSVDGRLERQDAERVSWDGTGWVGQVSVQRSDGSREELTQLSLPLPPPRQAEALVRPRAIAEAGLVVLGDIPLPGARAWWHRRLAGLGAPGIVALLALGLARRRRPGLAGAVALSAVGAGSLHLGVAVLAEALGPIGVWGAWGLAVLGGVYLTASMR